MVGTARCAVRAVFSGAMKPSQIRNSTFRPLHAVGAAAAQRPYLR